MTKEETKKRIEKLKASISRYRHEYHVYDKSLISDEALDSLKKELFDLEAEYPDLVTPDSPTQRIGGEPLKKFKKVTHERRMSSLNDAFSRADMNDWLERLEKYLDGTYRFSFYCDLKMDGLAVELVYENGIFVQGSTRGDGIVGEDVTQNLKTIEAIPLKLEFGNLNLEILPRIVVRGEVFLDKKEFARINNAQVKKGEKVYANPRNVAAGSIRQLNPKIAASRRLQFFAYGITGSDANTHDEEYAFLKKIGVCPNPEGKVVHTLKEVHKFYKAIEKKREKLPYEIDGIVVMINENAIYEQAGIVGKAPRAAIAYKFAGKEATTKVINIHVQVGRTGVLTPVATLEPVQIGGVTITHATLHNADEIKRLDIRVGDTVIVERAGDVIPKIINVLKELRTHKEKPFHFPEKCPFDGSRVIHDGALYRCSNKQCGARNKENLYHFVSRGAFNIEGLGPKIIDRFLDEGLIIDAASIFKLQKGDINVLDQFGEKSAENLVTEIKEKKKITLPRFLFSLGILHVGEETANLLAEKITNHKSQITNPMDVLQVFHKLSLDDLQAIRDIGPKVALSIYEWFREERNEKLLTNLDKENIHIKHFTAPIKSGNLSGQSFVLTGTFETMTRKEAKEKIRALGGNISESVSKKTNFIVVGLDPGSKFAKAKKAGVEILTEEKFVQFLNKK